VVSFTRRLRRWRGGAIGFGALAAALAGIVVTAAVAPERLPAPLRPKPKVETVEVTREVVRTVEVPAPSRFVAVLQGSPDAPAFIMTVDLAQRSLTVRRVSAEEQTGKSYELWLVSDKYPAPRSLGVIGAGEFTQVPALQAYDQNTIESATFAVSLEPEGGSPTGIVTGPVLFSGKLLEAVPPTRSP
jgi:anti-sigma-K factor RskA